jgi:hypothetical protein
VAVTGRGERASSPGAVENRGDHVEADVIQYDVERIAIGWASRRITQPAQRRT